MRLGREQAAGFVEDTEADPIAILVQLLVCCGALAVSVAATSQGSRPSPGPGQDQGRQLRESAPGGTEDLLRLATRTE